MNNTDKILEGLRRFRFVCGLFQHAEEELEKEAWQRFLRLEEFSSEEVFLYLEGRYLREIDYEE